MSAFLFPPHPLPFPCQEPVPRKHWWDTEFAEAVVGGGGGWGHSPQQATPEPVGGCSSSKASLSPLSPPRISYLFPFKQTYIFRAALGLSRKDRFPIYPTIPTHTQPPPLLVPQSGTLVTVSGPTLTPHYYPYPQHICICEQHPGASGAGGGRCPLRCCSWSLR